MIGLGPNDDVRSAVVELRVTDAARAYGTANGVGRVVVNPCRDIAAVCPVIVGRSRAVVDRHTSADRFDIGLRAR